MRKAILLGFFLFLLNTLSAQRPPRIDVDSYVALGKTQMDAGNYVAANKTFRKVLDSKATIPSEMCYYFAETLFFLGQYQNSMNFADKYIELTGKSGDFYKEVIDLKSLLETESSDILRCNLCDKKGYLLRDCEQCNQTGYEKHDCYYCKAKGLVSCPTCEGRGVVIAKGKFDDVKYQTCPTCDSKGRIECPVCHGNLTLDQYCTRCLGTGIESSDILCTHEGLHDHDSHNH
ncbi:MAG: molecular chaperone DnaJ [Bacteroidota bacterium]